jgi:hypothetical protein
MIQKVFLLMSLYVMWNNSLNRFMLCFSIIVKFWTNTILIQNFNWNYFFYLQFSYLLNIVSFALICFKFGSHLVESRICKCLSLSLFFTYKFIKLHCVSFFSSFILSFYLYFFSFITHLFSTCKQLQILSFFLSLSWSLFVSIKPLKKFSPSFCIVPTLFL